MSAGKRGTSFSLRRRLRLTSCLQAAEDDGVLGVVQRCLIVCYRISSLSSCCILTTASTLATYPVFCTMHIDSAHSRT